VAYFKALSLEKLMKTKIAITIGGKPIEVPIKSLWNTQLGLYHYTTGIQTRKYSLPVTYRHTFEKSHFLQRDVLGYNRHDVQRRSVICIWDIGIHGNTGGHKKGYMNFITDS
jgi:hypothetical protein